MSRAEVAYAAYIKSMKEAATLTGKTKGPISEIGGVG